MTPDQINVAAKRLHDQANPPARITGDNWRQAVGQGQVGFSNDFVQGAKQGLNPINAVKGVLNTGQALTNAVVHPVDTANAIKNAPYRDMGQAVADHPGEVGGNLIGSYLLGKGVQGLGVLATTTAPKIMDAGLWRSGAQRLEFPNTPQRLVDERIIPTQGNVRGALEATEQKINNEATAYDAVHGRLSQALPHRPFETDPQAIAQQAKDFATKEGRVGGLGNVPGQEASELDALQQNYLAQNTRPRSLAETIDQKRAYQARASYPSRPNAPTQTGNEVNFNKGVAGANRDAAIQMNPNLANDLSKEQDLIGADTALKLTEARSSPMTWAGIARHALTMPRVMGTGAITADRIGDVLAHPALLRAVLLARLGGLIEPGAGNQPVP